MRNRDSLGYAVGKFLGRMAILGLGYILEKKWGQRPIDKGYPKKKINLFILSNLKYVRYQK